MNAPEKVTAETPRLSPLVARVSGQGAAAWKVRLGDTRSQVLRRDPT